MKVYFANMLSIKGLQEYLPFKINILAAYPSFKSKGVYKPEFCDNLFVDSGAFGKHSKNIELQDYIDFIKKNTNLIDIYANLDVIGNARKSWKNQRSIEKSNLNPIPVFHYNNDFKYLDRCLNNYDYFALGGLVPISGNYYMMRSWLDRCWDYILSSGNNKIKVHGFGIQNLDIAKRYPWFSIDSSSVHIMARYGGIYTPWGTLKINPNVNSREMAWQVSTPMVFEKVKEFAEIYLNDYKFEEAQGQDNLGVLLRCSISIQYLLNELSKNKSNFENKYSLTSFFD